MSLTDKFRNQCIAELSDAESSQKTVPEEKLEEIEEHRNEGNYFKAALAIGEFNEESPISYEDLREREKETATSMSWDEFREERGTEWELESENPDETDKSDRDAALEFFSDKEGKLAENLREELENDE